MNKMSKNEQKKAVYTIIDSFIIKYLKLVSINNKKLKYHYSRGETMLMRQILSQCEYFTSQVTYR